MKRLICAASTLLLLGCPSAVPACKTNGTCATGGGDATGGGSGGGGGGGGTPDAGPTALTLDQACGKVAKAIVDRLVRCKQMSSADAVTYTSVVQEQCNWPKQVSAGLATFDGKAAAECGVELGIDPCVDTSNDLAPACSTILGTGTGHEGAPCTDNTSCSSDGGLYCPFANGCTTCQAAKGVGEHCSYDPDVECRSDLACNDPNYDGGTCAPTLVLGGLCGFDLNTFSFICNTGLRCNYNPADGGSPDCEPPLENGVACMDDTDCAATSYCPMMPATCTPRLADGMPCNNDVARSTGGQCVSGWCNRDLTLINRNSPDVHDAGGPSKCGYLLNDDICFLDVDCGPGNHCKGYLYQRPDGGSVPGRCAPLDPDGGPCVNSATRGADSCANPLATCLDSLCVVTPEYSRMLSQSCDYFFQCAEGTRCNREDPVTYEGHCVALSDDDGPCFQSNECKLGDFCLGGSAGSGVLGKCRPLVAVGQACNPGDTRTGGCEVALDCMEDPDGGTGLCQGYVGAGSPCDDSFGPLCYGSYCAADAGMCVSRQANGAECSSPAQCGSGSCANPDGGFSDETCQLACF